MQRHVRCNAKVEDGAGGGRSFEDCPWRKPGTMRAATLDLALKKGCCDTMQASEQRERERSKAGAKKCTEALDDERDNKKARHNH